MDRISGNSDGEGSILYAGQAAWCASPLENNIGSGMDSRKSWKSGSSWYPHSNSTRTLTSQEAFGNGIRFVNFHGTGAPTGLPWLWMMPDDGLPTKESGDLKSVASRVGITPASESWESNLNSSRTPTRCFMGDIGTAVANGVLGMTSGVTSLMGGIATFAFDPNFICQPGKKSNCIDLVGIIGGTGTGSNDGLLGKLTNSVYFPLLALAALLVGAWVMWNGLAKRQFRETFVGVLWSIFVLFAGVIMLLNPQLLAKAPMAIGNVFTSCIVGTFSGSGDCGGTSGSSNVETGQFCVAKGGSSGNPIDQASITMTGMSCELWKAFVLQPYAQGSFGIPLDQLTTTTSGTVANKIIAANPGFKDQFCVGTKTAGVLDTYNNKTLQLGTGAGKICNVAVYQAYLGVDAKVAGIDATLYQPNQNAIDNRWLKVALFAASDDGMYHAWAPSDMHFAQIGLALLGLISAIMAAVVIFVVAAFAMAFYVTSILMIAFAPFFMLAGIHPGRGRKMMIGWIGQVLSNIMKYIASAIFLVITVSMYSAVLANVSNPGAILIFMLILTVALLMYRREIVDMIGVIDLGGEKLSNKFAEKTMDRVKNTGKTAMAVGAGVTAGVLSNGVQNPFSKEARGSGNFLQQTGNVIGGQIKHAASGVASGTRAGVDSGRRSIKARPGMIGEVMKSSDRISADNRQKMAETRKNTNEEVKRRESTLDRASRGVDEIDEEIKDVTSKSESEINSVLETASRAEEGRFGVESRSDELDGAELEALDYIENPAIKELQEMLNQISNLEIKASIAREAGDLEEAAALDKEVAFHQREFNDYREIVSDKDFDEGREQYNQGLAESISDPRVTVENAEDYQEHVRRQYQETMVTLAGAQGKIDSIRESADNRLAGLAVDKEVAVGEVSDADYRLANAEAASEIATDSMKDLRAGKIVKSSRLRKQNSMIDAQLNDQRRNLGQLADATAEDLEIMDKTVVAADNNLIEANGEVERYKPQLLSATGARDSLIATKDLLDSSKREVLNEWTDSDDALESSTAKFIRAEEDVKSATARVNEFEEIGEENLSRSERKQFIGAKNDVVTAQRVMENQQNTMDINGGSQVALENFKRSVEDSYNENRGSEHSEIRNGLTEFEAEIDAISESTDANYTSAVDEKLKLDDAASKAAKLAMIAKGQAKAARSAVDLAEKGASSKRPISEREAAKIERRVGDRMPNTRPVDDFALPNLDEIAEEALPQPTLRPASQERQAPVERKPMAERPLQPWEPPVTRERPTQPTEQRRAAPESESSRQAEIDAEYSAREAAYLAERREANSNVRENQTQTERQTTQERPSQQREEARPNGFEAYSQDNSQAETIDARHDADEAAYLAERRAAEDNAAAARDSAWEAPAQRQASPANKVENQEAFAYREPTFEEQRSPKGRSEYAKEKQSAWEKTPNGQVEAAANAKREREESTARKAAYEARERNDHEERMKRGNEAQQERDRFQEKEALKSEALAAKEIQKSEAEIQRLEQARQKSSWNEKKEQAYQNKQQQLIAYKEEESKEAAFRESERKIRAERQTTPAATEPPQTRERPTQSTEQRRVAPESESSRQAEIDAEYSARETAYLAERQADNARERQAPIEEPISQARPANPFSTNNESQRSTTSQSAQDQIEIENSKKRLAESARKLRDKEEANRRDAEATRSARETVAPNRSSRPSYSNGEQGVSGSPFSRSETPPRADNQEVRSTPRSKPKSSIWNRSATRNNGAAGSSENAAPSNPTGIPRPTARPAARPSDGNSIPNPAPRTRRGIPRPGSDDNSSGGN